MLRLNLSVLALLAASGFGWGCSSDTGTVAGGLTGGTGAAAGSGGTGKGSGGSSAKGSGGSIGVGGGSGGSIDVGGTAAGGSAAGGSGGGGTMGMAGGCVGQSATGQKGASATLLLLVDTSRSMTERVGMQTKLAATQTALNQSFMALPDGVNVGLIFFPHVTIGAMPCFDSTVEVPIAALDAAQRATLTTQVSGTMADGSTPTHDAYNFAVQTIQASQAVGDKYIVLITDGEPTYTLGCVGTGMAGQMLDNTPLINAVQAAYTSDGIKTFVIGSPGSESARTPLSTMARVGGTGPAGCSDTGPMYCHFDMTTSTNVAASLTAALGAIQQQIPVDCSFDLPPPPSGMMLDLTNVNVTVVNDDMSQTPIARDPNNDCATEGWVYEPNASAPTGVKLCGALCDMVKSESSPKIDVTFGCAPRVNPPK
jgi:Mg-chelatase subunit ChlD